MKSEDSTEASGKRRRDNEEDEAENKPAKALATEKPALQKDKDGYFAELGTKEFKQSKTQKRVTVSSFKGNVNVHFREYYEKDGKMLPGKSGLSLNKEQFNTILALAEQIQAAIQDLE